MLRDDARRRTACLLGILLAACGDASPDGTSGLPAAPREWQVVASSCGFSFRAPEELRAIPVQPIDSCVERYETDDCRLVVDAGYYAPDLREHASEPEHRSTAVDVDGHAATMVTFRLAAPRDERAYVAALHVPAIDVRNPELDLFLWTACTSGASRDRLAAIFSTVDLAREVDGG